MASNVLVPSALPEAGREILKKSKLRITNLHGPGGELPMLEKLVKGAKEADVVLPRETQPVPRTTASCSHRKDINDTTIVQKRYSFGPRTKSQFE